jgi:signal transduction histidine kinase
MPLSTYALSPAEAAARAREQKRCLAIILAVASLVTPELDGRSRERMERLRAAAQRMRDLLSADIDESGDGTSEVDVRTLFEDVCEMARERAHEARVELVLDCGGGSVRVVEAEMEEALFNVVTAAIDATPPRRAVWIRTELGPGGGQVWTIRDGSSSETRGARRIEAGRAGLGVALAAAIVRRHGGALRSHSARGRGNTVTIELPGGSTGCRDGAGRQEG